MVFDNGPWITVIVDYMLAQKHTRRLRIYSLNVDKRDSRYLATRSVVPYLLQNMTSLSTEYKKSFTHKTPGSANSVKFSFSHKKKSNKI